MGCCCAKKTAETEDTPDNKVQGKKSSSSSGKKKKGDQEAAGGSLAEVEEYNFNSTRDDWKLQEPKNAIQPDAIEKLEHKVEFESPKKSAPPNQISNVILFDTKTGSEIYKKMQEKKETPGSTNKKAALGNSSSREAKVVSPKDSTNSKQASGERKSSVSVSMKTEFFKTKVDGVEKIAVVFTSDTPVNQEYVQQIMSDFMDNVQSELPEIFKKDSKILPPVAFAFDSGRPLKSPSKTPRREIVRRPQKKIDYNERFNKMFGKYFEPGPGHITLPQSAQIDELPGFSQVKPGWLNINNTFYFIILIERTEGCKYLARLRANPATSLLADETQGDFFQCEYAGLEMLGLRLFHAKNNIPKIDKAQRILLMDNMKDLNPVAIHTDYDYRQDPYDIENCCRRLELQEDVKREYLLISTY